MIVFTALGPAGSTASPPHQLMCPLPVALRCIHVHCSSSVAARSQLLCVIIFHEVLRVLLLDVLQQLRVDAS